MIVIECEGEQDRHRLVTGHRAEGRRDLPADDRAGIARQRQRDIPQPLAPRLPFHAGKRASHRVTHGLIPALYPCGQLLGGRDPSDMCERVRGGTPDLVELVAEKIHQHIHVVFAADRSERSDGLDAHREVLVGDEAKQHRGVALITHARERTRQHRPDRRVRAPLGRLKVGADGLDVLGEEAGGVPDQLGRLRGLAHVRSEPGRAQPHSDFHSREPVGSVAVKACDYGRVHLGGCAAAQLIAQGRTHRREVVPGRLDDLRHSAHDTRAVHHARAIARADQRLQRPHIADTPESFCARGPDRVVAERRGQRKHRAVRCDGAECFGRSDRSERSLAQHAEKGLDR